MREQLTPTPEEIAKAEGMIEWAPEQKAMSHVRATIITPLEYLVEYQDLPEEEAKIIRDFSEKAADATITSNLVPIRIP